MTSFANLSSGPYLNEGIKRCFVLRSYYRSAKQVNFLYSRLIVAFDERSELTDVNRRSAPAGAKVNGSHNHAEQRHFALLRRIVEGLPETPHQLIWQRLRQKQPIPICTVLQVLPQHFPHSEWKIPNTFLESLSQSCKGNRQKARDWYEQEAINEAWSTRNSSATISHL